MKTTENNIKAFYEAIEKNDYNTISELIESDKDIVNAKNSSAIHLFVLGHR